MVSIDFLGTSTNFQSGGTSTIFSTLHGSLWLGKDKGSIMESVESGGTHSIIHYNVKHFKGSYGRPESHISSISDYQFCACVMRTSGVPQLQVIRMERLYGYK